MWQTSSLLLIVQHNLIAAWEHLKPFLLVTSQCSHIHCNNYTLSSLLNKQFSNSVESIICLVTSVAPVTSLSSKTVPLIQPTQQYLSSETCWKLQHLKFVPLLVLPFSFTVYCMLLGWRNGNCSLWNSAFFLAILVILSDKNLAGL